MTESVLTVHSTQDRLRTAAIRLFARKWYSTVSVAEICREAGLSNGVFYRYYATKEVLFREILGTVLQSLRTTVMTLPVDGTWTRLETLASSVFEFTESNSDLVSIFREGQYRFFEYEHQLVEVYTSALAQALGGKVDNAAYLFVFGGLRFCSTRHAFNGSPVKLTSLYTILDNGLYRGLTFDPAKVFGGSALPPPLPLEESTRDKLITVGKKLFGETGYFETNIHDITNRVGLSVGVFYTYFKSKEVFYAEIIAKISHDVRGFISSNLGPNAAETLNPLEYELRGLWIWLVYLSLDRHCYNIVREAESVLPEAVKAYYESFVAGYAHRPEALRPEHFAPHVDPRTATEYLLGIAHYLGMEVVFEEAPGLARNLVEALGGYLAHGVNYGKS